MYLIQNGLKNLVRNRGRNILLLIVILAVICAATAGIVINQTAKAVIDNYKTRFGATAQIVVDWEKMEEYMMTQAEFVDGVAVTPTISVQQYQDFADSQYLKSSFIQIKTYVGLDGVKGLGESREQSGGVQDGNMGMSVIGKYSASATLIADANPGSMEAFLSGTRQITQGRLYEAKNECMVSRDFAQLNGLELGDTITVVEPTAGETYEKSVDLTVVGIYSDATPLSQMAQQHPPSNPRNEILVSTDTANAAGFATEMSEVTASYELSSPDVIGDFEKELRQKGLPEYYKLSTNEAAYQKVVGPVQGLAKISGVFMWVVLLVGMAVVLLVSAIAVRERKYEMAVLRAMGLKKRKVAAMLLVEMLVITSAAFGVGLGIGLAASQPVADALLTQQVEIAQQSQQNPGGFIYVDPSLDGVEMLTEISVNPSPQTIGVIGLLALTVALCATTVGAFYVTKYEPLRLLSERG